MMSGGLMLIGPRSQGISALENIIDELSMVYLKAIYKLENLH